MLARASTVVLVTTVIATRTGSVIPKAETNAFFFTALVFLTASIATVSAPETPCCARCAISRFMIGCGTRSQVGKEKCSPFMVKAAGPLPELPAAALVSSLRRLSGADHVGESSFSGEPVVKCRLKPIGKSECFTGFHLFDVLRVH